MAKAKKLPDTVFAKWEIDDENSFLLADINVDGLADDGDRVRVGVYKLVEVKEVRKIVETTVVDN